MAQEGIAIPAPDVTLANPNVGAESRTGLYLRVKRLLDVVLAGAALVLCAPLMMAIALIIRLDSPGPALFRQYRVGLGGRHFTIYKFRTMVTEAAPYSYKVPSEDPRVTRVGRWLRRTGLDELPQLWAVLAGEMSLVGPRPELPFIVEQYEDWQRARHSIRPGITGWWQIHHRNEVPMHLNLDYDVYYLRNCSFSLDCRIAWHTIKIILGAATGGTGKLASSADSEREAPPD